MAIVYAAQLRPSKMELLALWLPQQPWFVASEEELVRLGSFRFDDPAGEVGVETQLVGAGKNVYHVPMTYRGAPLEGAEKFLIGTMDHSVLGDRWAYDATGDPVYAATLAAALLAGAPQAVQLREADGETTVIQETSTIKATGIPLEKVPALGAIATVTDAGVSTISSGNLELRVLRELDLGGVPTPGYGLTAVWEGQQSPVLIATAAIL
ncbi:hypothetical protein MB46_01180 [Arthrobacter alpinus]|uniref:CG0192-related protein n=1 Tax=Arthrobacter alpinus TaxID=656366 RepID=UPI0005C9676B|nr:hypothetical protein [Arthrobacter alpinus]ALV44334.1 hypothetical protein MB46_01180 [Arthrobacter alpinus]